MTRRRKFIRGNGSELPAPNNPARRTRGTQTSRIEIHGGERGNAQYGTARSLNLQRAARKRLARGR